MTMGKKHGAIFMLLFCGIGLTIAQFEDLEGCLTPDFFNAYSRCFVEVVLNSIGIAKEIDDDVFGESSNRAAGRKLQSLTYDVGLSSHAQQYYIQKRLEQAGVKENKIFEELKRLAKLWSITRSDDSLSDKLRSLDVRTLFGDRFLTMLIEHLGDIMPLVMELRHQIPNNNAWNDNVIALLGPDEKDKLSDMIACLRLFPESAFEDGLDWLQCLVSCDDLGPLWTCTTDMMMVFSESCSKVIWFGDTLISVTASFLNKTHCDFVVDDPVNNTAISLVEGGPEEYVTFHTYLPPSVLCLGDPLTNIVPLGLAFVGHVFGFNVTCDVEMQLTTSNWIDDLIGQPTCRVYRRALHQVAIGYHEAAVNNSGVFKITADNWNTSFEIPLLPVVDHRLDGDAETSLTLKMYVQGDLRDSTVKIPITVRDTDDGNMVECYSINDPHIMTFDGHYYNNFYHGAFYMYKHDLFPYEVQTIFQPCEHDNKNATCNCAVAARSGDDVFVMDRCRRCSGSTCDVNQLTVLYTNGPPTSGTRVFRQNGGLRHDIVLPHGTIIKIITSNDLLNVWIMPGSYDKNHTLGLCGTYNGNSNDDLTMPDGSLYTGPGSGVAEQPRNFSLAWRVEEEDLIFYGARPLNETFSPLEACTCTHRLFVGAQCECGRGTVTELCDLFMENEYTTDNISSITHKSLNNGSMPYYLGDIDLDESYNPPDLVDWNGVWNETAAKDFCDKLIKDSGNELIQQCSLVTRDIREFCVQDIQILDNTNWKHAALDNAKFRCFNKLVRSRLTTDKRLLTYVNNSCVNDCNDNGVCERGVCICNDGFYGPDCQPGADPEPFLSPKSTELCDQRYQLCHFASIFGRNFPEDGSMLCQIRNVEISPEGVDYLPKRYSSEWERQMSVVSSNQAACPLPGNGSYEVYTVWNGAVQSGSWWSNSLLSGLLEGSLQTVMRGVERTGSVDVRFIYISYDSVCFTCDVAKQSCERKTTPDHCWINSTCWPPGATKPDDPCRYCDPVKEMNDWIISDATEVCRNQAEQEQKAEDDRIHNMTVRGAIGGSISAFVIIVVIILYCISKKKEKAKQAEAASRDGATSPMKNASQNLDGAHDNIGLYWDADDLTDVPATRRSGTPQAGQHVTRVEVLKIEERQRTHSIDGSCHDTEGQATAL